MTIGDVDAETAIDLCERAAKIVKRRRTTEGRFLATMFIDNVHRLQTDCRPTDTSWSGIDEPGSAHELTDLARVIVLADVRKRS